LLTHGCIVEGTVRRSVLFPGTIVEEGAVVEDSILFFDTVVEAGATVKKVISDKLVRIGEKARVGGGEMSSPNESFPEPLTSGLTVIGRNTHLPPTIRVGSNCILYPYLDEDFFQESDIPSGATVS
jgi:glucose-1-phosphate adenylyltransferase